MRLLPIALLVLVGVGVWFATRDGSVAPGPANGEERGGATPLFAPSGPSFVGSETCKECHQERHATWLETGHAYSLREAIPETVAGRFDGKTIRTKYYEATPYQNDGQYFVRVVGLDDRPSGVYRVTAVVGRLFEQAYLFTGPNGEWRVLPICWSITDKTWHQTHEILEDIAGHVQAVPEDYDSRERIFNHGCGQCHATNYDVGHIIREDSTTAYKSSFLEGAVACESCHGPGRDHAAWYKAERAPDTQLPEGVSLLRPHKDLDAQGVLESCGRCHYQHGLEYAIGDDPRTKRFDIAHTRNYDKAGFTADGRLTGLNYHGSTQSQSPCFLKGDMSCLSCHQMHGGEKWGLRWVENSNQQCTQCHEAPQYEARAHTFHEPETRCVDCHMPRFMDGVLHFMRDHRIRSPQPELTERYGQENSPNACNVCHKDQTPKWAREHKESWWGVAPRRLVDDVGQVVALRKDATQVPTDALAATVARPSSELFFRLTALSELSRRIDEPQARQAIRAALTSDHVEVIQVATRALSVNPDPNPDAVTTLVGLLSHPLRTIRVSAGFSLARLGWRSATRSPITDRVWADTIAVFERQLILREASVRAALLADALHRPDEEFQFHFTRAAKLLRNKRSDPTTTQLLLRRTRRLTEAGEHQVALKQYQELLRFLGEPIPILLLDSADSLAAVGQAALAVSNWRAILALPKPPRVLATIARARLAHSAGTPDDLASARSALVQLIGELERDPIGGQSLRRAKYALDRIDE